MPYTQMALQSAVVEVKHGSLGLRAASKKYHVPLTTLHDHTSGKVALGAKKGKETLLSLDKENDLIEYAMKRCDMGIGFSKQSFLRFSGEYAASEGVYFKGRVASEKWWRGFKVRHPNFSLRTAESTATGRHMSMTRSYVTKYFAELKSVLSSNDLLDNPSVIWNMDETGLSLAPKPPKVIARKGAKLVHAKASNSRELITIIACGNAAGKVIPPHVIVPGKTKRALLSYDTGNAPAGTQCSASDSGWTKQGISELWFTDTFLPNIGPQRPQVLIVDGHDSHHHVEILGVARKENVIVIELPSKTSHFTQPFDRSVFKAFKTSWGKHVQDFTSQTGVAVGHCHFFRLMTKAWNDALTSENVAAGFYATGICPYNPGVIPNIAYSPSDLYVSSTASVDSSTEEMYTAHPLLEPTASTSSASAGVCTLTAAPAPVPLGTDSELIVSMEIHHAADAPGTDTVVDLPVSLDEHGMLNLLEELVEPQQDPSHEQCQQPFVPLLTLKKHMILVVHVVNLASVMQPLHFQYLSRPLLMKNGKSTVKCMPQVVL